MSLAGIELRVFVLPSLLSFFLYKSKHQTVSIITYDSRRAHHESDHLPLHFTIRAEVFLISLCFNNVSVEGIGGGFCSLLHFACLSVVGIFSRLLFHQTSFIRHDHFFDEES